MENGQNSIIILFLRHFQITYLKKRNLIKNNTKINLLFIDDAVKQIYDYSLKKYKKLSSNKKYK